MSRACFKVGLDKPSQATYKGNGLKPGLYQLRSHNLAFPVSSTLLSFLPSLALDPQ
jgi:hypothetical protein